MCYSELAASVTYPIAVLPATVESLLPNTTQRLSKSSSHILGFILCIKQFLQTYIKKRNITIAQGTPKPNIYDVNQVLIRTPHPQPNPPYPYLGHFNTIIERPLNGRWNVLHVRSGLWHRQATACHGTRRRHRYAFKEYAQYYVQDKKWRVMQQTCH